MVCQAPADTTGYAVSEHQLLQSHFKVEATCASAYIGNAAVVDCTEDDPTYKLSGCEKKVFCKKPSVAGYDVTETSVVMQDFKTTASCSAGYHGAAQVAKCSETNTDYSLSGCTENVCLAPTDVTGYTVTEKNLRQPFFEVEVGCAEGYGGNAVVTACTSHQGRYQVTGCQRIEAFCLSPSVTDGYEITETDLRMDVFKVTATCASGWSGTAQVGACTGATPEVAKEYTLSGCQKVNTR